jgi:hypothetical protein
MPPFRAVRQIRRGGVTPFFGQFVRTALARIHGMAVVSMGELTLIPIARRYAFIEP